MEEKNASEKIDEARDPRDEEEAQNVAATNDEASGAPSAADEGTAASRDRKSHRTLLICVVAFAVLLVAAGVAYNALAPAAEKADLVAEPSYRGTGAGEPGANAAPSEEGAIGRDSAGANASEGAASSADQAAPNFTAVDVDGKEVTLADFRGRPVVLNFWASWCGPCQSEMPAFQEAFQRYGDDVQFLMVNMTGMNGESREAAMGLIEAEHYTFPVFFDQNSSAARAYGVNSIPQTWFIDADGAVAARAMGALSESRLQQGIELITQ